MHGRGGVYKILVEKPEGKGPLGRPRRRLEDNITVAGPYEHGKEPSGSIKGRELLD
jgi:hypothetical protein